MTVERSTRTTAAMASVVSSVGLALLLAACGARGGPSAVKGTLAGTVTMAAGSTTLRPPHAVTIEVVAGRSTLVARRHAARGGLFDLRVAPGHYRLDVVGLRGCHAGAVVRAGERTVASVRCPLVDALSSVAFATLPTSGAVTTRADAMKRLARQAKDSTRIDAVESTWAQWVTASFTGSGGPVAPPTHLSPTSTVWVACASGGTDTTFNGTSGYTATCTAYAAQTGQPLGTTDEHGWPSWFTRLASAGAGA